MARAREAGRTAVCMQNVRQIMVGMTGYAADYRSFPGTYYQGPINLDWAGRQNQLYQSNPGGYLHPFQTSVLRDYLDVADKIMECPSAKRQANQFFDYTMLIRMAGARPDLQWIMDYPVRPELPNSARQNFAGLLVLAEEHDEFYNRPVDDGSFAGTDQFSTRHGAKTMGSDGGGKGGGSNIGFLDASVAFFRPPVGGNDRAVEPQDLNVSELRVHKARGTSFSLNTSNPSEFGWINRTR
jgi:hypothetical protein